MAFEPWQLIAASIIGGVAFLIICTLCIYLCRRRMARRRIKAALQMQENYQGQGQANTKSAVAVMSMSGTAHDELGIEKVQSTSHSAHSAVDGGDLNLVADDSKKRMMSMKSIEVQAVDDEDSDGSEEPQAKPVKAKHTKHTKPTKHRILDLTAQHSHHNNQGSTPIIEDSAMAVQSVETFSGTAVGPISQDPLANGHRN